MQSVRELLTNLRIPNRLGGSCSDEKAPSCAVFARQIDRQGPSIDPAKSLLERHVIRESIVHGITPHLAIAAECHEVQRPLVTESVVEARSVHTRGTADVIQGCSAIARIPEDT